MNCTKEYRYLLSWKVLYPSMMKGWWSLRRSYIYCCMYLKRVWLSICDFEKQRSMYNCLCGYFSLLTTNWGPNYDSFIYFKITKSERLAIWGFSLLSSASLSSISATLSRSLMTVSSSPPIMSFTRSTFIYARTPLLYIMMSSSYLHRLLI